MKKFALFSDILFSFFVSGLLTLCLFRHLGVKLPLALLLAILCGALTACAVGAILISKRKTLTLKKSDESMKEKLLLHLALLSDEGKTQFFKTALASEEKDANRFGRLRVYTKTEFYFLRFSLAPVSADDILPLGRLKTNKQKILLCAQINEDARSLCERLGIAVWTGEWVFHYLKEKDLLPERYLGEQEGVNTTKRKWKSRFSKSNAKRFLVGGGILLLLAQISPFYYYYLVVGIALLLVAVYLRVFG